MSHVDSDASPAQLPIWGARVWEFVARLDRKFWRIGALALAILRAGFDGGNPFEHACCMQEQNLKRHFDTFYGLASLSLSCVDVPFLDFYSDEHHQERVRTAKHVGLWRFLLQRTDRLCLEVFVNGNGECSCTVTWLLQAVSLRWWLVICWMRGIFRTAPPPEMDFGPFLDDGFWSLGGARPHSLHSQDVAWRRVVLLVLNVGNGEMTQSITIFTYFHNHPIPPFPSILNV